MKVAGLLFQLVGTKAKQADVDWLRLVLDEHGEEAVRDAITTTLANGAHAPIPYMDAILRKRAQEERLAAYDPKNPYGLDPTDGQFIYTDGDPDQPGVTIKCPVARARELGLT